MGGKRRDGSAASQLRRPANNEFADNTAAAIDSTRPFGQCLGKNRTISIDAGLPIAGLLDFQPHRRCRSAWASGLEQNVQSGIRDLYLRSLANGPSQGSTCQ